MEHVLLFFGAVAINCIISWFICRHQIGTIIEPCSIVRMAASGAIQFAVYNERVRIAKLLLKDKRHFEIEEIAEITGLEYHKVLALAFP